MGFGLWACWCGRVVVGLAIGVCWLLVWLFSIAGVSVDLFSRVAATTVFLIALWPVGWRDCEASAQALIRERDG